MNIDVEGEFTAWRTALKRESHLPDESLQELEDHLRDEMDSLKRVGLREDEALIVGFRRLGSGHELARVDTDKLWKHLFAASSSHHRVPPREIAWVIGAAILAAALGKVPILGGVSFQGPGMEVYVRNFSLFVAPILMIAYIFKNGYRSGIGATLFSVLCVSTLAANLYPFPPMSDTSLLLSLHLPLLLWLGVGLAYCGDDWRTVRSPLDFIRFSGEFFLYSVLILCGGVVLVGLIVVFFEAIKIPAEDWATEYVALSGLLATPVVAAFLVEKKRSLIENLAPVLARIFIPLFLLMMIGYVGAVAVQRQGIVENRDMLITIDLLLLLVVGMVLYDLSARSESERFYLSHGLNVALIGAAIVIDTIALYGIAVRLSDYGFTPNRTAALGENVLLLGNLVGLAVAYVRFATGRVGLTHLWSWQVRYLPAYAAWLAFVVFAFPPLFGFR